MSNVKNVYTKLDYELNEIIITNYNNSKKVNILNIVSSLNVYEDIFSNSLTAEIELIDTLGLFENFPIIGEEEILVYTKKSDEYEIAFQFFVYKISDRYRLNDRSYGYTLYCVSKDAITNLSTKISRSYKDYKISDIVSNVFTNYIKTKKKINIENTKYSYSLVVPNYSPYRTIDWLSRKAISNNTNEPNYVFYEGKSSFNFVSLSSLVQQKTKYVYNIRSNYVDLGLFDIQNITSNGMNDSLEYLSDGVYSSKLFTYDTVLQKYNEYNFDWSAEWKNYEHLSKYPDFYTNDSRITKKYDSRVFLSNINSKEQKNNAYINDKVHTFSCYENEVIQQRNSYMKNLFSGRRILISIIGFPDISCGDIIELDTPSSVTHPENLQNKLISGRYIITSMKHIFTNKEYMIDAEIVQEGFLKKL